MDWDSSKAVYGLKEGIDRSPGPERCFTVATEWLLKDFSASATVNSPELQSLLFLLRAAFLLLYIRMAPWARATGESIVQI